MKTYASTFALLLVMVVFSHSSIAQNPLPPADLVAIHKTNTDSVFLSWSDSKSSLSTHWTRKNTTTKVYTVYYKAIPSASWTVLTVGNKTSCFIKNGIPNAGFSSPVKSWMFYVTVRFTGLLFTQSLTLTSLTQKFGVYNLAADGIINQNNYLNSVAFGYSGLSLYQRDSQRERTKIFSSFQRVSLSVPASNQKLQMWISKFSLTPNLPSVILSVYADYNFDGIFDLNEKLVLTKGATNYFLNRSQVVSTNMNAPIRVRVMYGPMTTATSTVTSGEVEDYNISIVPLSSARIAVSDENSEDLEITEIQDSQSDLLPAPIAFPNPATDMISFSNLNSAIKKIQIVDMRGASQMVVEVSELDTFPMDIQKLPSGSYIAILENNMGSRRTINFRKF